ncbi:hypothetical protein CPB84DRAFT_1751982 [Gymnopilus junonius]|uniref:Uncharacterized protein n=1 Tax=Gymnopilus junonius TaxID=109634 RepID=A0A9P5NCW7_GYMJU|nr:hypothetical protein CPB84DRAFT_1751982 [Gymnopilus junonius]
MLGFAIRFPNLGPHILAIVQVALLSSEAINEQYPEIPKWYTYAEGFTGPWAGAERAESHVLVTCNRGRMRRVRAPGCPPESRELAGTAFPSSIGIDTEGGLMGLMRWVAQK